MSQAVCIFRLLHLWIILQLLTGLVSYNVLRRLRITAVLPDYGNGGICGRAYLRYP
jgi:hypothetical protein